jgi:hypothetical protein
MTNEYISVGAHFLHLKSTESQEGAPVGEDILLTKPDKYTKYESYRQDKPLVCTLLELEHHDHEVIHSAMHTSYNGEDSLVLDTTACFYGVFKTKSATHKKDKDV